LKCEECAKEFEKLNVFSPYGHNNPLFREESLKNTGYCDKCFETKTQELDNMVYNRYKENLNAQGQRS